MPLQLSLTNPLRKPGYRFFLLISACAAMGGGFHFVASYWILYSETSSPSAVAWLSIAFWAPSLIVMPVGGVLVDRWNRRLLIASLLGVFLALNLGLLALIFGGVFQPRHLYVYAALSSIPHGLFWTALMAYLQEHLSKEERLNAHSLNTALMHGGYLAGAGMAGLLFPYIGAIGSYLIDSLGLTVAVVGWLSIQRWFPDMSLTDSPRVRQSFISDYVVGVRYIVTTLPLFLFALFAIVPRIASQIVNVLNVGFSKDVLGTGSVGFGLIDMSFGIGAMLCGLFFPPFVGRFGLRAILPSLALSLAALVTFAVSFANSLVLTMVLAAILSAMTNVVGILSNTALQREAANHVMGRITSTVQLFQYLLVPPIVWAVGAYASLPQGYLVHEMVLRDAFVAASLFFVALVVVSAFVTYPFLRARQRNESGVQAKCVEPQEEVELVR